VATWEARNAGGVSRSFAIDWLWRLSLELISFALGVALFFVIFKLLPAGASCGDRARRGRFLLAWVEVANVLCALRHPVRTFDRVASDANIVALFLFLLWVYYTAYLFLLAAKWRRCTIWSACDDRSGCNSAEQEVGGGFGGWRRMGATSSSLPNLPDPSYWIDEHRRSVASAYPCRPVDLVDPAGDGRAGASDGPHPFPVSSRSLH